MQQPTVILLDYDCCRFFSSLLAILIKDSQRVYMVYPSMCACLFSAPLNDSNWQQLPRIFARFCVRILAVISNRQSYKLKMVLIQPRNHSAFHSIVYTHQCKMSFNSFFSKDVVCVPVPSCCRP